MQEQTFKSTTEFDNTRQVDAALILTELQLNLKALESLLVSYHYKSRGRVFDVKIQEESLRVLSDETAIFSVRYNIGQFNACADLDYTEKAGMEILVDIDRESNSLRLTGEFVPEREPDEL